MCEGCVKLVGLVSMCRKCIIAVNILSQACAELGQALPQLVLVDLLHWFELGSSKNIWGVDLFSCEFANLLSQFFPGGGKHDDNVK